MFCRSIAAGAALLAVVVLGSEARAAELAVLSNEGRTLSVIDTVKSKVLRSVSLKSGARLVSISTNSVEREIWGLSDDRRLIIFDLADISEKSRTDVLEIGEPPQPLLYCTDESVYCNLIISKKQVVGLNEEGAILVTADLPKASYRKGQPSLIGFGSVSDPGNTSSSKVFAIDGEQNALIRLPPAAPNPKWKFVAKLSATLKAPLAFDTLKESGGTRGYAILEKTLYTLNLKNGQLTKPRAIKGLKGNAQSMSFYAAP